jgi:hypothetical protein
MKRVVYFLVSGCLSVSACTSARLSHEEARKRIAAIGQSNLVPDAIEIRRIVSQSDNSAIAEATATLAINEARRRTTLQSMQTVVEGVEKYRVATGNLPDARDIAGLMDVLHPSYMRDLVREDGWGRPIIFELTGGSTFRLISPGADGRRGTADDVVLESTGANAP